MKRKKLIRSIAIVVMMLALFVAFPGRVKNELLRDVHIPLRVNIDGPDFVFEVCDVLENQYYDSDSLDYPVMFNSALHAVSVELDRHNISFIPDTLKSGMTEDQCKDFFADEFNRAKKIAEPIKDSLGYRLEFVAAEWLLISLHDSHCYFIHPSTWKKTQDIEDNKPIFYGIGTSIGQVIDGNDTIFYFEDVFPGSPARKAGLRRFDRILKIDSISTAHLKIDSIVSLIKGEQWSVLSLKIERKDSIFTSRIIRNEIFSPVWSADTVYQDGKMFIDLRLYTFDFDSKTRNEIENYLWFAQFSADGIIFDLRGNLGGYVINARGLLEMFLEKGSPEFYEVCHNGKDTVRSFSKGEGLRIKESLPVAILINQNSASSSEIFSSVMREHNRATIVGEPSAGHLCVALQIPLSFGSAMSVSVSKFFTAHNCLIEGHPIIPDVPVKYSKEGIIAGYDSQLKKAAEVLIPDI